MKRLPIGIQDFKDLVESGYLYVDKTRFLVDLIEQGKV
ncbi:MAG TPA: AAA family ATPase [Thermotogota bacterium]|nr:AAA family ATPase [Thermotogota bacterium]